MMDRLLFGLVFVSALGCGLIAGVFFAFSAFVIKGLSRLPPGQGIGGMQSINIAAITPVFMIALFGTAALCAAVAVLAVSRWQRPGAAYLLTGGLLYIFGTILVTILFNVPRNEALANVDPTTSAGVKLWADYLTTWTAWNHVRTIAALGATASFIMAISVADA